MAQPQRRCGGEVDPHRAVIPQEMHDASVHAWHHTDAVLFRIVRESTAAVVVNGYKSNMSGFADILIDADILAYIKSTWPDRERDCQTPVTEIEQAIPEGEMGPLRDWCGL